jgi:hypothetical protein
MEGVHAFVELSYAPYLQQSFIMSSMGVQGNQNHYHRPLFSPSKKKISK